MLLPQAVYSMGWDGLLVEGQTVRQNEGTPLNIRLLTLNTAPYSTLADAIADQWQAIGINTAITTATSGAQLQEWLTNGEFDVAPR